jgi:hypothetical protein
MDRKITNRLQLEEKPITRAIALETLRHIKEDIPEPYKPMKFFRLDRKESKFDKHMRTLDKIISQYK